MSTLQTFSTGRQAIAGIPVAELAEQFGTPTYVYDEAVILERIKQLRAFDVIRYAQKANSNLAILDLMRRQDVLVDAVSAGEVHRAISAGYGYGGSPPQIVYTADIFDRAALELVVKHDIHCNLGSPDMINQLGDRTPGRNVTLRINPGFGHGHSQKTNTGGQQSKHGIWHEQIDQCLLRTDRHGLGITGLHMHIGSGTDLEHLAQVCGAMEATARQVGRTVTTISAGGGLPVVYNQDDRYVDLEQYYETWNETRNRLQDSFGHSIALEVEPGRFLTAECGYLIAEIRAVKQMGENTFYLLDAGFNNLARPILYGAYHPMSISSARPQQAGAVEDRPRQPVVVGGPLCESGDIFTQQEGGLVCQRQLPVASVGDFLVIECAGAYGFVMASNYNSKPHAAEALIRDGQAHLIRRRQSVEDLTRDEIIPD